MNLKEWIKHLKEYGADTIKLTLEGIPEMQGDNLIVTLEREYVGKTKVCSRCGVYPMDDVCASCGGKDFRIIKRGDK